LVFIIEITATAWARRWNVPARIKDLYRRAQGYNFSGVLCDGMDVLDVREKISAAASLAPMQSTPTLLEAKTYRYRRPFHVDSPRCTARLRRSSATSARTPFCLLKAVLLKAE